MVFLRLDSIGQRFRSVAEGQWSCRSCGCAKSRIPAEENSGHAIGVLDR
jgi:hypothetical protein